MNDENYINKIMSEYEQLRIKSADERKKRVDFVYKKFPRIKEIDEEIFECGKKNLNNILKNPEKKDEYNENLKENLKRLTDEKNKILTDNNIDTDFDKYKYQCEICHDTGYDNNGRKCKCFKQKLINEAYKISNMSEMIKNQNFENFSFEYYSDTKKENGNTERENIIKIYNGCKSFCENFDSENKSLLFYGGVGLGKTFLSSAVAKELMDKGKTVLYVRATRMFAIYNDYRFGRNTDKSIIDSIYNCDLLIIDDLGTEQDSNNNLSFLFDVVNERIINGKKIIINTNLTINEITRVYSSRFTSRLSEYFRLYKFFGEDIRLQKLKNK